MSDSALCGVVLLIIDACFMDEIFVHPSSVVDDGAVIGSGCRIWHFYHVMSGAVL